MKARKVDTVTSNEENVRLMIYDGVIPLGEAGGELLRLALAEHHRGTDARAALWRMVFAIEQHLATPWPVRWWAWCKKWKADTK